jgi:hypothetical protein
MSGFIEGEDRHQATLFPESLDPLRTKSAKLCSRSFRISQLPLCPECRPSEMLRLRSEPGRLFGRA